MRRLFNQVFVGVVTLVLLGSEAGQAQQKPLLMEGKSQLFQRVLIRDSTPRFSAPNGDAQQALKPLQALYVYEIDGDWMQVGLGEAGSDLFWVPAEKTIPWNQNIVATIEGSASVGRLLYFSDLDGLYSVVESEDPADASGVLRKEAEAAEKGGQPSQTIVALGPQETVDQRQNLYVMPILEAEEAIFEDGVFVNLLKVAVARAQPKAVVPRIQTPLDETPQARADFRAAVVFVVDTTKSMEPYISATRDALKEVYKRVADAGDADIVSFGLVGFRDNMNAAKGLEYQAKTFVDLKQGFDADIFLDGIEKMTEARAPSRNFREDSYGGIEHTLKSLDWSGFGARYIVLVTDAGPREAGDKFSTTGLSAEGLNALVKEQIGGVISVVHLLTPGGKSDHDRAAQAYRQLATVPNQPTLYFPIPNGDTAAYQQTAGNLGGLISDQVSRFRRGFDPEGVEDETRPNQELFPGARALEAAGQTMQLAYLGAQTGTQAPDVFEAYVADRDFDKTGLKPLSIRLLLSKNDLSNLNEALGIIVEQAEQNVIDPDKFFSQVLGAAADMSRSPEKVSRRSSLSLAEAVSVSEYLEGLPFQSRIMAITEDDWVRLSISEQQTIYNELYEKMARYRRYNAATDQWFDYLGTGAQAENLLYPMLLNDLP